MRGRVLVVGVARDRAGPIAHALRAAGFAVVEAASVDDVDGIGFVAVVGEGCGAWFARLRAEGRAGARIALDRASARHADATLADDAPAQIVAAVVGTAPRAARGRWAVGGRTVDLDRQRVDDQDLGPQETALLAALLDADGEAVSSERLLRDAWGVAGGVATRAVDHAAHRVRQVLEPEPGEPRHLLTVRGHGLRLVGARRLPDGPGTFDGGWPLDPPAVGTAAVFASLDAASATADRVALVGPAGTGKSVVARAWARARGWGWVRAGDPGRGPVVVDDLERDGPGVVVRGAVVATARFAPDGYRIVRLPDRSADLAEIAAETARSLGVDPPDPAVIAAVVARIGPNALGIVRFVERAAWLDPALILDRLDAGDLAVLGSPGARDPRHRSLATALGPEVAGLGPEADAGWIDAGLATRATDGATDGLRVWPALATWLRSGGPVR